MSLEFPRVMRAIAATAWLSVKSSGSRVRPRRPGACRGRIERSGLRARYPWANPDKAVEQGVAAELAAESVVTAVIGGFSRLVVPAVPGFPAKARG